ncbi:MAG TPA: hypothetical protein VM818_01775 [Vicinamibacterales bacterium]|nr:hypothetical protein [Vicinamibacterales bacterium]
MAAWHTCALAAIVLTGALASSARAQTWEPVTERQPLGSVFTIDSLTDLPSGSSIFSLLDSSVPELISDRVDAGGLTIGDPPHFGAHGSSWTQTMYRIGDVDISDPRATGTPLMLPGMLWWDRMDVATAAMPFELNAAGPVVTLVPRRPTASWTRSVEVVGAPGALLSRTALTTPPAIARLNGWTSAKLAASGPVVPGRFGLALAAELTSSAHFQRSDPTVLSDKLGSVFSHLVISPSPRDEIRVLGWFQRTRSPFAHRAAFDQPAAAERATSIHVQSEWERPRNEHSLWKGLASFSSRRRTTDLVPVETIVTERLYEGPVQDLLAPFGTDKAWQVGGKIKPVSWARRHTPEGGLMFSGGSSRTQIPFQVRVGELVQGVPARAWEYSAPATSSTRHQITVSAYAADTVALHPRVTIDGGLRFELVHAAAATNPQSVSWHDWFPTMGVRWQIRSASRLALLTRFNRYGYRLPLDVLAVGDASSPTANVYRWEAGAPDPHVGQLGVLVSRVGPGTAGDPTFSAIDPRLERPYVNELTIGLESRPSEKTVFRFNVIVRHEGQLLGLVNTGVLTSDYFPVTLIDPGVDHGSGQTLIAFDRPPSVFGQDQYLLTNPAGHHATFASGEFTYLTTIDKLHLMAGATAGRSEETSANRGFLASENDHGLIGEVFTDPNAATNARGRPFTERGYTIKTAGTYRFTDKVRLGVAARYQDGQHFARLVIVPDLNQGPEAIRAFVNGKTRFTYTLTLDARLQKAFDVRGRRLTAVFDVFNALNTGKEIEEFAVTGPLSRTVSAVQPPRSIHVGFKFAF